MEVFLISLGIQEGEIVQQVVHVSSSAENAADWIKEHEELCAKYDFVHIKQYDVDHDYHEGPDEQTH